MTRLRTRALLAAAIAMPIALQAQRGGGMGQGRVGGMGPGLGGNPVAPIIDMRRELNLTSRQLVRLDSIERTLLDRNQALRERLRARLDTARPRGREMSEEEIARFRAEADSMRAVRRVIAGNDSVARVAAMAVLTDSQRIQVRERQAERRGFMAGQRSRGGRGMGMRRPPQGDDMMPRGRRGMGPGGMGQGEMGMGRRGAGAPGPGMRRGEFGPGDEVGPRFYRRGQLPDDVGPRFRRRIPPDSIS